MGLFGFLKPTKPAGFSYRPRYFDEKKEGFEERLREATQRAKGAEDKDPEAIKERIRKNLGRHSSYMSDKNYRRQRVVRSNLILLLVIVVLIVATYAALELYLPMLLDYLGK